MTAAWLDHAGFVAPRLDELRASFVRLGFAPTRPAGLLGVDAAGRQVALGQSSAHVVFERGYVELSEVHSRDPAHHLARYASRYAGLHILALGCSDAAAAHAAALAAGVDVGSMQSALRRVDYGAQPGEARFRWFMLNPDVAPEALTCAVEHLTPERIFQTAVQRHPNGARALASVSLVSDEPADTVRRLQALGVSMADGAIEVLTPLESRRRWPGMLLPPSPCIAALRIEVADIDVARATCEQSGVAMHAPTAGSFRIAPEDAGGAVLEFASS